VRITRFVGSGFKAVGVDFAWAPVTVLFGRNDAGKTNILELIDFMFGEDQGVPRTDPFADPGEPDVTVELELDARDIVGHEDNVGLASLVQWGFSPLFWSDEIWEVDPDEGYSPLEWEVRKGETFTLTGGSPGVQLNEALARLREHYVEALVALGQGPTAHFEPLVDALLASRWFRCERGSSVRRVEVHWLAPPVETLRPEVLAAARSLAAVDDEDLPLVRVAESIVQGGDQPSFASFVVDVLRPFDVVRPRRTAASVQSFLTVLETQLKEVLRYLTYDRPPQARWTAYVPEDEWLGRWAKGRCGSLLSRQRRAHVLEPWPPSWRPGSCRTPTTS
jgi:hypothetical protein